MILLMLCVLNTPVHFVKVCWISWRHCWILRL